MMVKTKMASTSLPSSLALNEDDFVVNGDEDDERLAEKLQLQEVLIFSVAKPSIPATTDVDKRNSDLFCHLCTHPIPSIDIVQKTSCIHAFCSPCLSQHADETLRKNSAVLCPHHRCQAVLDPGLYREIVPPRVFDSWINAHRHMKGMQVRQATVKLPSYDRNEIRNDHSIQQQSQITQQGRYSNRDMFQNLANYLFPSLGASVDQSHNLYPGSETEVGESSKDNDNKKEEFYCNICVEWKPLNEVFAMKTCMHKYCVGCMSHYIEQNIKDNILSVTCPGPNCENGILEPEMCRSILPTEVYDRWGSALCESSLGENKLYCPYKDCSALVILDDHEYNVQNGGEVTDAECPHCWRMMCAQCKVPWHSGISSSYGIIFLSTYTIIAVRIDN